jgi:hypothetical protein
MSRLPSEGIRRADSAIPLASRSSLWELLFAVEKARDESPSDESGWTKMTDVLPVVNAAYSRMQHPLSTIPILKTLLSYCIARGVVSSKQIDKNGQVVEYVQPTDDFAALRMYVDVAQPRVPMGRSLCDPMPWYKLGGQEVFSPGNPSLKTRLQLLPVIQCFWKGGKVIERLSLPGGVPRDSL